MRKKAPKYNKDKSIKSIARKRIGSPSPSRPLTDKPVRTRPKHKKSVAETEE